MRREFTKPPESYTQAQKGKAAALPNHTLDSTMAYRHHISSHHNM